MVRARVTNRRRGATLILAAALGAGLASGSSHDASAAGTTSQAAASGISQGAGQTGPRSAVPWRRVGAGWVLAQYWPGRLAWAGQSEAAAATLYLIDPAGGRYLLYRWPASKSPPFLLDWSSDKTRALVSVGSALEQVFLATGRVSHFRLAGHAQVIGYTRPGGHSVLGYRNSGPGAWVKLGRYSVTGRLEQVLAIGADDFQAVYSDTGGALAIAAPLGLQLISNRGGVIRSLPVPRASTARCSPSRWWNSSTILASCPTKDSSHQRLWLVPADGAKPRALTPQRGGHSHDRYDLDAWQLPGRLYLAAIGSSGRGLVFRQAPSGSVRPVTIPRTAGNNWILAAHGSQLLILADSPCDSSRSLLWFSPATRHEHVLLKAPAGLAGVAGVVPYGASSADFFILASC